MLRVALLCGIGWYFSRQTNSAPSEQAGSIPTGWVQIINRKTGKVIHLNGRPVRIEPSGEFYKLRSQDGRYVAIAAWAKNGDNTGGQHGLFRYGPVSGSPSMLWKIEPCGNGFWTITNCQSKKCLVNQNPADVVRQSTFRDGALEQQWRFEPVSPPSTTGNGKKSAQADGKRAPPPNLSLPETQDASTARDSAPWHIAKVTKLNSARPGVAGAAETDAQKYLHIEVKFNVPPNAQKKHKFRVVNEWDEEVGNLWGWNDKKSLVIFEGQWDSLDGLYLDGPLHREPLVGIASPPRRFSAPDAPHAR